ncbi:deazaflavin-dependent oxidoreductase, nitroreductase family [Actinopolymorpha cephalotaxi]|uniref:Deazaflavin-dependent oxidoreductase (Nitroreductase family) n=1 Tax=Actinopolymorpha cephalotaxi TaxID=504797 RepID=A0A1I2VLF1_9ACTN|nr:nitroreductase family deazaflavin-dependent oxidoreductase [Actinopolymorpha cephalotaxi]NYH84873.1 deazaflavin-dependent oxidoreductase (nitroreductase family) [Actinopolymorpha cephalotaxi]SFG88031.1 deazaflavin-dependent oxidoreductase, nitroreductase family [Actinopolymorpha cephalotaxi]
MKVLDAPQPPSGLRRLFFRAPIHLYRAHLGRLLGGRFMLLTHTGRVSGNPRQVVIEAIDHDPRDGSYVGPSGYGRRSDWYRNILANPDVTVQVGRQVRAMTATPLPPAEGGEIMARYAVRYPRLAPRLARFMGFEVDGSKDDYRAVGERISFVRFTPAHLSSPGDKGT